MKRRILPLGALLLVAVAAAGWWLAAGRPPLDATAAKAVAGIGDALGLGSGDEGQALSASGFIEAEEATVAAELGGRILALHADEGDEVQAGQVLVELDTALLLAQIEQAEADLAAAEAALAKIQAGVRPQTLAHAEAVLAQARAAEEAGRVAWEDAQALCDNPQQIELALLAARAQLGVLDLQTQQAQALANAAQAGRNLADTAVEVLSDFEPFDQWVLVGSYEIAALPIDLPPGPGDGEYRYHRYRVVVHGGTAELWYLAPIRLPGDALTTARYEQATATYQSWQAWTGLAQAQAAREGVSAYAQQLEAQAASPLALQARANTAESQYRVAGAAVTVAEAQVTGMHIGATPEQIAAAQSQVDLARAALDTLRSQLIRFELQAPIGGLVLARPAHVGEVAGPGVPLLTVADLDRLTLTVYVPEGDLGRVTLDQTALVTVDAYPGRTFEGRITYIAAEAEFTPKNVQTEEDRVNMVFAVKITLPNPDRALKPGMPADAVLGGEQ